MNNNTVLSRVFTVATVAVLVFALNISGALAGFWRTIDGQTANGIPNPAQFLFGLGTNNGLAVTGYGYGYGFGYGEFNDGNQTIATTSSSTSTSGGSS